LILLQFGEGSVKGFALTMTFGLIANLFTGLTVTYTLCEAWFNWRNKINLGFFQPLTGTKINFIGMRKGSFVFSSILIVAFVGVLISNRGPNMAVDFEGGVLYEAAFTQDCTTADINAALEEAGLVNSKIQKFADSQDALIRARLIDDSIEGTKAQIDKALEKAFGADGFNRRGASAVTSEVGQEFYMIAWVVILCASAAILIYLGLRFERTFGVAAVVALVHDLFLTLGIVTLCGVEISLDVVSAFLILLGYSANDTIVIFDRIRENAREAYAKDLKEICNSSMNQSLTRTLITSLTTAFVMFCMYALGGHSLQPFALTLIFGVFFGTYSSSFIAAPIVYEWTMRKRAGQLALTKATQTTATKRGRRAARPSKRGDATT